jgi:hypothetical protein
VILLKIIFLLGLTLYEGAFRCSECGMLQTNMIGFLFGEAKDRCADAHD